MLDAFLSRFFAGFASVIASMGLSRISGDLGPAVRICFVFVFVPMFAAAVVVPVDQVKTLTRSNLLWLGLSGVTTAFSWVFYCKAIKMGEVSTVARIDKGSVVVAQIVAAVILHEVLTPAKLVGCGLIIAELLVIARGQ